jgi:hypothetical protein
MPPLVPQGTTREEIRDKAAADEEIAVKAAADILDKCNDIFEKCVEILEKVS